MNSILSSSSPSPPIFNHKKSSLPILISHSFTSPPIPRSTSYSPLRVSSSSSDNPAITVPSPPKNASLDTLQSASHVVRDFYHGINRHDLASVEPLIAENCVYEDLIFSRPFVGRKEILLFFKKFNDSISKDLQFVIDDISTEDSSALGVLWHLEWKGKEFPFSKGCSFYRLVDVAGKKQIIYARDSVEPAFKPGEIALMVSLMNNKSWASNSST
ncbi:uncharacterized protein LOC120079446 isoform X2 [Benincasa hispida]|uniref:uncharacterized protein LOC120079446 isoform X2 n=1 Tax=Benincasa hispida TaxID=102211 RepID=UPI001901A5E1|nr:uncharacterized protein LOC120079446 isoform X2 [Benincasa hispida]